MKYLSCFLLLWSCSTTSHLPLKKLQAGPQATKKSIKVEGPSEARKILSNRKKYLELLFEQSHDPYYGQPKWTAACLKENKIGEVVEVKGELQLVSTLVLDRQGMEGHCSDQGEDRRFHVLYLYCPKATEVVKLTLPYQDNQNLKNRTFCP